MIPFGFVAVTAYVLKNRRRREMADGAAAEARVLLFRPARSIRSPNHTRYAPPRVLITVNATEEAASTVPRPRTDRVRAVASPSATAATNGMATARPCVRE